MASSITQTNDQRELYKGILLYPSIIRKIKVNEERLIRAGYKESKKKPLLFYKPIKDCTFFADMRGTKDTPIWKDTSAVFYVKFTNNLPDWKKNRIIKIEIERLEKNIYFARNISGFYGPNYEDDEDDPSTWYDGSDGFWNERVNYGWKEDGYCKVCGNDFQDSGFYCSEKCASKVKLKEQRRYAKELIDNAPTCEVCKRMILANEDDYSVLVAIYPQDKNKCVVSKAIEHHTSYEEDITMMACASCHAKIHQSNEWCEYTPVDSRTRQHPKTKLVPCNCYGCKNKARVDYTATKKEIEKAICHKCKSKGRAPKPTDEKIKNDIEDAKRRLKDEVKAETKREEFDFIPKR